MPVIAFALGLISLAITISYRNGEHLTEGESHPKGAGERNVHSIHKKILLCQSIPSNLILCPCGHH